MDHKIFSNHLKHQKFRSKLGLLAGSCCALLVLVVYLWMSPEDKSVYGDFPRKASKLTCKIPNMSPFDKEAMDIFQREEFKACSPNKPLTSVANNEDDEARLIIHEERASNFTNNSTSNFTCCYQRIMREINEQADTAVTLTKCKDFSSGDLLDPADEFILVTCNGSNGFKDVLPSGLPSTVIYKNAHAIVRAKEKVSEKLNRSGTGDKISVLMMGIDSISRLNLIRALPQTYDHLVNDGWFELRGYNKIADNSYPNLMASLTGLNDTVAESMGRTLEKCRFLWNDFDDAGYATAFAEDDSYIHTFNFNKGGFLHEPTDYYFRPFTIGAERHLEPEPCGNTHPCLGFQHYADHIYQFMLDFAVKYRDKPSFGLFWTSTFSHDYISMPSTMDSRVLYYLEQLKLQGVLDASVVIFFSDHGMRFGPIRDLFIGWLEERLPFLYIWLPPKFQKKHREIVRNLRVNANRLSSPFNLHLTLKHILKLSEGYEGEPKAQGCEHCKSLFDEIPADRTCAEAGINNHWCTCVDFEVIDKSSELVKKAASYILKQVNADLSKYPQCAKLELNQIKSAQKSLEESSTDYLVSFNVNPSDALLEATVRCVVTVDNDFSIVGSVSRLNSYGNQSYCIDDAVQKKYCYCI